LKGRAKMTFLVLSIIVFIGIAILIPKRMTRVEMYATSLFSSVFQLIVDHYLADKHDLYGYFTRGVEYEELLVFLGVFPPVNIIFLNFFPFEKSVGSKAIYIIGWSTLITLYEWGAVLSGYFFYNGWKLWYSALAYPVILCILALNLSFIRKLKRSVSVNE
jgi:hypothetical protein